MRYGVISDIHANMEALEKVLEALADVDAIWCLGDIVGYGPEPNLVARRVREVSEVAIMGNHDHAAVGKENLNYFSPFAGSAALWTQGCLDADVFAWLSSLPFSVTVGKARLVHSGPSRPKAWEYLFSVASAESEFGAFDEAICFVGHSHMPALFELAPTGRVRALDECAYSLDSECRYILNVGSVGQPRDGDPRASCAVYDDEAGAVELRRVEYGISVTQEKIHAVGLPAILARRLSFGE